MVEEKYSSSLDDNTLLSNFGITRQISSKSQINITITHSSYHMLNLYPPVFVFAVTSSLSLVVCLLPLSRCVCSNDYKHIGTIVKDKLRGNLSIALCASIEWKIFMFSFCVCMLETRECVSFLKRMFLARQFIYSFCSCPFFYLLTFVLDRYLTRSVFTEMVPF